MKVICQEGLRDGHPFVADIIAPEERQHGNEALNAAQHVTWHKLAADGLHRPKPLLDERIIRG